MPKSETFDREQVLRKVTNIFWEKGYNGTSMQDIVDVTGLNRSSLYNSFGDKYALFSATVGFYQENVQSSFFDVGSHPPKQALRKIFERVLVAYQAEDHQKGCYLANLTTELAGADKILYRKLHSNMKDVTRLLSEVLQRGVRSGDFDPDLPIRQTALFLFNSIQGLRVTGVLISSEEDLQAIIDRILDKI